MILAPWQLHGDRSCVGLGLRALQLFSGCSRAWAFSVGTSVIRFRNAPQPVRAASARACSGTREWARRDRGNRPARVFVPPLTRTCVASISSQQPKRRDNSGVVYRGRLCVHRHCQERTLSRDLMCTTLLIVPVPILARAQLSSSLQTNRFTVKSGESA
jgi:hypothetical protein